MAADWGKDILRCSDRNEQKTTLEKALIASRLGSQTAQCFLYNIYLAYNPYFVYNIPHIPFNAINSKYAENPWSEFWAFMESVSTDSRAARYHYQMLSKLATQFDAESWQTVCIPVMQKNFNIPISIVRTVLENSEWKIPKFNCATIKEQSNMPTWDQLLGKRIEPVVSTKRILAVMSRSTVRLFNCRGKHITQYRNIVNDLKVIRNLWDPSDYVHKRFILDGVIVRNQKQLNFVVNDLVGLDEFQQGTQQTQLKHRLENLYFVQNCLEDFSSAVKIMPGFVAEDTIKSKHMFLTMEKSPNVKTILVRDLKSYYCDNNDWPWHTYPI